MNKSSKIVVLGAGSVGCFFGGMLARAGHDVTLIARANHVEAISKNGLYMDCQGFQEYVAVKAQSDYLPLASADIVLCCVKSPDTESVINDVKTYLNKNAVILSLQNGVDNAERITKLVDNPTYPTVVYVATAMVGPGKLKHFGRGELVLGSLGGESNELNELSDFFQKSKIPCEISSNIKKDLWLKFLVNCSYNGISAIGQIQYGKMVSTSEVVSLINQITKECLMVAEKEGVVISSAEADQANHAIGVTMSGQKSSTAQDLAKGKLTEIDYLNGLIVRRGAEYGLSVSANQAIYALVKMLEKNGINTVSQ
ncbi:MAG: ketopantoate reductase family protein [Polynucleobacter victoriensis]